MANLLFQKPTDNIAGNATLAVNTGTEDTAYPAANLADVNPAKPAKLTTTTGSWVFSFPAAVNIDLIAIIHHNLTAGLEVRIQGNATNAWGAPSLNQLITIPAYRSDGFPVNPFKDLTGVTPRSYQFWRLVVVGVNASAVQIGEVWLGATKRLLAVNIRWNYEENDDQPLIEHTTDFRVKTVYSYGVSIRRYVAQLTTTNAGAAEIYDWWRSCRGRAHPMLIALDADVNDCMMARFNMTYLKSNREFTDYNPIELDMIEVSRGLVL